MPQAYKPKTVIPTDWTDPERASVFDPLYKRAIRTVLNTLGVNGDPEDIVSSAIPSPLGTVTTAAAKRIAPKKAAKELADVLMGRSSRVPPGLADSNLKAFQETRLARAGIGGGVTGSSPPPPTRIKISEALNSGFRAPEYPISRAPGLTEGFKLWQRSKGLNPRQVNVVTINPNAVPDRQHVFSGTIDRMKPKNYTGDTLQSVTKSKNFKLMSERELQSLIDGPMKAMKRGFITEEEGRKVLGANRQRIEDYFNHMKEIGKDQDPSLRDSLMLHINALLNKK